MNGTSDILACNHRLCQAAPGITSGRIEKRYTAALDVAIDRIVCPFGFAHDEQLVGLAPDGSLPEVKGPCR